MKLSFDLKKDVKKYIYFLILNIRICSFNIVQVKNSSSPKPCGSSLHKI